MNEELKTEKQTLQEVSMNCTDLYPKDIHNLKCNSSTIHQKERDEQQQMLTAKCHNIQELERQLESVSEELRMVHKVGMTD